jgi:hypothetical protein
MRLGDQRNVRILIAAVLLLGTGALTVRVLRTMHEISATRGDVSAVAGASGGDRFEKMRTAMDDRRALRGAVASLPRDPFGGSSAPRTYTADSDAGDGVARVAEAPKPAANTVPALKALVYDNVRPSVQLACEDAISPWLGQGDTFKGWTVLEIGPGSVWIRNGSRKQELGMK